jgi:hypothetical protein
VRLKTTFGMADQASANAASCSLSGNDGSVSHTSIVSYSLRPNRKPPSSLTAARWKRNVSSLGIVHANAPSRSAMKPSTETPIV